MKHFLVCLCVLLAGCQSTPNQSTQTESQANIKPRASQDTTPYTEFMGDDQIQGLVTYANSPLWKCTTCASGQTSGQVLAEVNQVIALHPNVVVILTGAYDEIDDPQQAHAEPTVANIAEMCAQLEASGIKPLVFFLPDSTAYDDYWTNNVLYDDYLSGVIPSVLTYPIDPTGPYAQYTAGVDFSQAGLAIVYPLAYQEIEDFQVGGLK